MTKRTGLKSMLQSEPELYAMADSLLVWFRTNDTSELQKLAKGYDFASFLSEGGILSFKKDEEPPFHIAMIKDIADPNELADFITSAHTGELLPLFLAQYSDDKTDTRGENVFDIFCTSRELSIDHVTRVYSKNKES